MMTPSDSRFSGDLERWASLHEDYLRAPSDGKAVTLRRLARRLAGRVSRLKRTVRRKKARA